jgi:hypothetical protein
MKDDPKSLTIHLPREPWNERDVFTWEEIDWNYFGGSPPAPEQLTGDQIAKRLREVAEYIEAHTRVG